MKTLDEIINNAEYLNNLSAYKIYWAEFFPTTGRFVTQKDIKALGDNPRGKHFKTYRKHFPSKEKAIQFIFGFNKKLSKRYRVLLCTDKQFGMAKQETGYAIPYTLKQLAEDYYIG